MALKLDRVARVIDRCGYEEVLCGREPRPVELASPVRRHRRPQLSESASVTYLLPASEYRAFLTAVSRRTRPGRLSRPLADITLDGQSLPLSAIAASQPGIAWLFGFTVDIVGEGLQHQHFAALIARNHRLTPREADVVAVASQHKVGRVGALVHGVEVLLCPNVQSAQVSDVLRRYSRSTLELSHECRFVST